MEGCLGLWCVEGCGTSRVSIALAARDSVNFFTHLPPSVDIRAEGTSAWGLSLVPQMSFGLQKDP